jgi:hypothetical protein
VALPDTDATMPNLTKLSLKTLIAAALLGAAAAPALAEGSGADLLVDARLMGRPVTVHLPRAAVLHRFVGELVDAAGQRIAGPVEWTITVGSGAVAIARLSNQHHDLQIPRPYGLRLDAGDSLVVVAELPSQLEGASLRVRMEYEEPAAVRTRLPAQARTATALDSRRIRGEEVREGTWSWVAQDGGRLVAITGRQLIGAEEVILEDTARGTVVWRMRAPPRQAGEVRQVHETLRPGVALVPGRTYRLRIVTPMDVPASRAGDTPLWIVVP